MIHLEIASEVLANRMVEIAVQYFPITAFIEQVEYEKYCMIMDALTCDNCTQKRGGICPGKELESMDSIIEACLYPKIILPFINDSSSLN